VLPLVIDEENVFIFEYWFDGTLRQGMYYHNELFSRVATFDIHQRPQVYQYGCKLTQRNALIVLTCTPSTCSLWGSLRSTVIKEILLDPTTSGLPKPEVFSSPTNPSPDA
jgi:hypothetical protein